MLHRICFINGNRDVTVTHYDYNIIKESIKAKEKFVELYDGPVEFINLEMINYIIELAE